MASKKYRQKTCVYCASEGASSTGDHVLAREFFILDETRENLPIVPACEICNNEKSKLEHYLLALLPQAARRGGSSEEFQRMARSRVERNQKLKRSLEAGASQAVAIDGLGRMVREDTLPIESDKLLSLCALITKGLLFHHWQVILPKDQSLRPIFLNDQGDVSTRTLMNDLASNELFATTGTIVVGDGVFEYEGAMAKESPLSVWRMNFYAVELGHADLPNARTTNVFVHVPL